ncbi:TonB-dependent receptor domain-containing protein, partial [Steroidobacter sp.]|uniref:TonB-dependent receptor domain-containing protein n=1 Tax=Steroidobacter sp. TaxID=1978227 RepID=UPI001A3FD3C1
YKLTSRETNQRITSRFFEALDAISDPLTGNPVCRSESARAAGCQPLNILGMNAASDAALAYFRTDRTLRVTNTQTLAGAQLTGKLFDLPAGALASAIGVEYRRDTRSYKDDPLAELGLLSDKAAGTSLTGEDSVSEAFLEVVVPLLRDKPLVHDLSVEGAVRVSDYDSIGSTTAWKYGGSWSPVKSLRLRATASRSVRAPNLYELFAPRQISQINIYDPCELSQINTAPNRATNCHALGVPVGWEGPAGVGELAIFNTVGGGNRQLDPETSDAWTVGFVFTPEALPALSIAIDYWNIEIEDAVQPLDVTAIVEKCVDSATIDNVFCPRVTRGADSTIDLVDYSIINVGKLSTDGVDVQVAYVFDPAFHGLDIPGRFTVALNASYLRSLEELIDSSDPASLLLRRGEYNTPAWRGTLSLGYQHRGMSVDLDTRVIGKARIDMNSTLETYDRPRVPERIYNDLALGYAIGTGYNLRLAVNNLFDVEPPQNPYTYLGANGALYDSIGRYFVLGGTARF